MRLLFAFLVIISHSPELIDGNRNRELLTMLFGTYSLGEFAVNSFFILSGYLITSSWISTPEWSTFIRKRLLRILPGFIAATIISLLIIGPISSPTFWEVFNPWRFFAGLPFLIFDLHGFHANKYQLVNGALWTIHYEFVCYLLVAALGLTKMLYRPRLIGALFLACLVLYIGTLVVEGHTNIMSEPSITRSIWVRLTFYIRFFSFFLAGAYLYLSRAKIKTDRRYIALSIAAFCALMTNQYTAPIAMTIPWVYMMYVAAHVKFSPSQKLGGADLSYGLYLCAWPIQQLLIQHGATNPWVIGIITTVVGLTIAAFSWFFLEKPALRFKPFCYT